MKAKRHSWRSRMSKYKQIFYGLFGLMIGLSLGTLMKNFHTVELVNLCTPNSLASIQMNSEYLIVCGFVVFCNRTTLFSIIMLTGSFMFKNHVKEEASQLSLETKLSNFPSKRWFCSFLLQKATQRSFMRSKNEKFRSFWQIFPVFIKKISTKLPKVTFKALKKVFKNVWTVQKSWFLIKMPYRRPQSPIKS